MIKNCDVSSSWFLYYASYHPSYTCFFYKQHFYKQNHAEFGKKWGKAKKHLDAELFANISKI